MCTFYLFQGVAENMKMPWQVLEKYFLFEPSDSIKDDLQVKKAKISQGLNELSKHGEEVIVFIMFWR